MTAETPDLDTKYNLLRLGVISSSAISSRTSDLIKHVKLEKVDRKTAVVSLHAKASVANKLISIVEIAKRDLKESGVNIYQYNALGSEMVNVKPTERQSKNKDGEEVMSEEEAFETMGQKPTVRAVPTMTVYLSAVPIKELKDAYGEQLG